MEAMRLIFDEPFWTQHSEETSICLHSEVVDDVEEVDYSNLSVDDILELIIGVRDWVATFPYDKVEIDLDRKKFASSVREVSDRMVQITHSYAPNHYIVGEDFKRMFDLAYLGFFVCKHEAMSHDEVLAIHVPTVNVDEEGMKYASFPAVRNKKTGRLIVTNPWMMMLVPVKHAKSE